PTAAIAAEYEQETAPAQAATRQADLARELAALQAARPVAQTNANLSAGQIVANPGGGAFMCPVFGAAYTDDYGGPRGHPGNDLFVPIGTQAFAVKAGSVRYVANE